MKETCTRQYLDTNLNDKMGLSFSEAFSDEEITNRIKFVLSAWLAGKILQKWRAGEKEWSSVDAIPTDFTKCRYRCPNFYSNEVYSDVFGA